MCEIARIHVVHSDEEAICYGDGVRVLRKFPQSRSLRNLSKRKRELKGAPNNSLLTSFPITEQIFLIKCVSRFPLSPPLGFRFFFDSYQAGRSLRERSALRTHPRSREAVDIDRYAGGRHARAPRVSYIYLISRPMGRKRESTPRDITDRLLGYHPRGL